MRTPDEGSAALEFKEVVASYVYCFVLHPFDKDMYNDKPWQAVKPPEGFPVPAIVPSYKEWELGVYRGTVRLEGSDSRQRQYFTNGGCCGNYELRVTIEETGWGVWQLKLRFQGCEATKFGVNEIWALNRLGSLPKLLQEHIRMNLNTRAPFTDPIARGIRRAGGLVTRLDALFEYVTEQVLQAHNLSDMWVEKRGLESMIGRVTDLQDSQRFLLMEDSFEYPKYSPGVTIALGLAGGQCGQSMVARLERVLEDVLRIVLGITRLKKGDMRALAHHAKLVEREGDNWRLINWLPVENYVLLLHPGKAVAFYDNERWKEEVDGTLEEIQDLNVSWYVHSLAGVWIDKRLQEIPSLKRAIERELNQGREDIGRRALEIQRKLVEVVMEEKSMLARVFEEPIHHKLSFGGMQTICQYYLDVMGLQRLWDVCFQKLNVLGRLYDELMDYVRLRDAESVEQRLREQEQEAIRFGRLR